MKETVVSRRNYQNSASELTHINFEVADLYSLFHIYNKKIITFCCFITHFFYSQNILSMEIAAGSPLEGENLILNAITISGVKREVKTVKLLDTMETITTFFNTKMNVS